MNDCFVEGVTPTISIKSGDLTGVDLDIKSYEHATKTVYLEELDSEGYILPSVLRKLQVGNEYVFLGIKLPDAYKITAEADLYEATDMASQESAIPGVSFGLTIDEKYIRDNNFALKVGDRPLIKSTKLGISNRLRITAIKFPLVNPASITATVGNVIVYQRVDQLTIDSKKNSIAIKQVANQVAATKPQLGAFLSYRGEYDSTVNYYGGKDRVEVVLYDGDFYRSVLTAGTFKGFTPTNPVKWKKFDGQFDSLATGLLLAELAYIENLGVRFLSTDTEGHKRFEINGVDNNAKLIDALDRVLLLMDDDSAFEGVYYTLFPPIPDPTTGENPKDFLYQREIGGEMRYYYATMGAGLSIGLSPTDSGGFTSLGRKEVYSTAQFRSGSPDRSEESTMNKDGFKTTGGLSVGGDTNLDGDVQILGDIFLEPSEKGQSFYMTFANSSLNGGAVGTHTIGFLKGVAYEVT